MLGILFYPEAGDSILLQNIGKYQPDIHAPT
jgi:hypothetical protein